MMPRRDQYEQATHRMRSRYCPDLAVTKSTKRKKAHVVAVRIPVLAVFLCILSSLFQTEFRRSKNYRQFHGWRHIFIETDGTARASRTQHTANYVIMQKEFSVTHFAVLFEVPLWPVTSGVNTKYSMTSSWNFPFIAHFLNFCVENYFES